MCEAEERSLCGSRYERQLCPYTSCFCHLAWLISLIPFGIVGYTLNKSSKYDRCCAYSMLNLRNLSIAYNFNVQSYDKKVNLQTYCFPYCHVSLIMLSIDFVLSACGATDGLQHQSCVCSL